MPSVDLIKAVAVTAELCGRTFSEAAAEVFVNDLAQYPEHQVIGALSRCRREVRGLLTVQDVVSRLEDGRPGADEAWAQMPFDEDATIVWTEEMCQAWGVAQPLLYAGDKVAARMAFKDAYAKLVSQAREQGRPPKWSASLGQDPRGRETALRDAEERGLLPREHVQKLLPRAEPIAPAAVLAIESGIKATAESPEIARQQLAKLRAMLRLPQ